MKKWLIFAVIAAMFAMVMFSACPSGDDGGGAASDVELLTAEGELLTYTASGTEYYIVTFQGAKGYTYSIFTIGADDTEGIEAVTPDVSSAVAQSMIGYKYDADEEEVVAFGNDQEDQWFALLPTDDITKAFFNVGVAAFSPGGYPLEKASVAWGEKFYKKPE
jgi:hypothetical protein